MMSEWMKRQIKIFGIGMSRQQFLILLAFVSVMYFIFFKVSEKHYCLLVDHNYGYSIEFPANRVVNTFGKLGNHSHIDEKARFYPRTILPFLQTSMGTVSWAYEIERTNEALLNWGEEQIGDDWVSTSGLKSLSIGQDNYAAWTTTFRRGSWQMRHYYIPYENGAFLIMFMQRGSQDHLSPIRDQMLDTFFINDEFITDKAVSFERRTIDCIR